MSRKLLKQMTTEWRSNLWLLIELTVVSIVMWYVADYLFMQAKTYSIGMGMDTENVFKIDFGQVPSGTAGYDPTDTTKQTAFQHKKNIYERLRQHPDVEIAAITACGIPFEMNMTSTQLNNADPTDSLTLMGFLAIRNVTPEYFELLRIHGAHGESPAELRRILESGAELVTPNTVFVKFPHKTFQNWREVWNEYKEYEPEELIGRRFINTSDSTEVRIGGLVNNIQRMPFESGLSTRIRQFDNEEAAFDWGRPLLRVKPGKADGFAEKILRECETTYRSGNQYVERVTAVDDIGRRTTYDDIIKVRNHIVLMLFLLASIFLGLLGTFWFRTQQRVSEIAIRKVNGAKPRQIFSRLIGEGMALLTVATIPAIAGDWLLTHFELNQNNDFYFFFEMPRFAACVAIAYALMALMVVAGIWFPASRAMKLDAASALKDD